MTPLRRPFRRALAVSLAMALPVGLWLCTGQPLLAAYGGVRERIAQAEDRLARAQAIAVGREELARQLAALKARMAGTRTLLAEDSPALAAAGLQSRLKKLVEDHGGDLKSVQALPERDEDGLRRVTVRVALTCSVQGLRGILHAIETGTPFLFVDNLDLRGRTSRAAEDAGGGATTLDVRFDAAGLLGRPKGGS